VHYKVEPPADQPDRYSYWRTISFEEYKALHPHSTPEMGVLEVLAHKSSIHWATNHADLQSVPAAGERQKDWLDCIEWKKQEFIVPPHAL